METTNIVKILKEVDVNYFLKPKFLKGVLADLLYDYETEQKILYTLSSNVNVIEKLYNSKNRLLDYQNIKTELRNYGLADNIIDWGLNIWSAVLDIKTDSFVKQVVNLGAGGSFTVFSDKTKVFSWGNNKWGQLGNGTTADTVRPKEITQYLNLREGEEIVKVMTSFRSAYLYTSFNRVFAWGNNQYGQVGDGTTVNKSFPIEITHKFSFLSDERIQSMDAGGYHAVLATNFNRVFAWGNNEFGQLGDEMGANRHMPYEITNKFYFQKEEKIEHISIGLGHSLLSTNLGRIFSWGNNEYGQLGDGTINKRNKPLDVTSSFYLLSGELIKSISAGSLHSLISTTNGRVFAFGNNENGQLGDGTATSRVRPVEVTGYFRLLNDEVVVKVLAGRNYSLALTSIGRVFAWGSNQYGQLTLAEYNGKIPEITDITNNIVKGKEEIVDIAIGASSTHSFAITTTGKIYAWGNNENGQIGALITDKRKPVEVMI